MKQGVLKACPKCGAQIHVYAVRCHACGDSLPPRTGESVVEQWLRLGGLVLAGASLVVLELTVWWAEWANGWRMALEPAAWLAGFALVAGFCGWLAWSVMGRRRAYGVFVFALGFSAMTLGYALYLFTEEQALRHQPEMFDEIWSHKWKRMGALLVKEGRIPWPGPGKVYPLDKASRPWIDFLNRSAALASGLDAELARLNKTNVLTIPALTNRPAALRLELEKRETSLRLFESHQRQFVHNLRAARREAWQAEMLSHFRRLVDQSFVFWLDRKTSALESMFNLLRQVEQSEAEFLRFLIAHEGRARLDGDSLEFQDPDLQREFLGLRAAVGRARQEAGTVVRASSRATGTATIILHNLVQ